MSSRKEIISGFYGQFDEDGRTYRSRHGQLEFCTTMAYIHRYVGKESKILEVGAGTGRYSIALAKEGMDVTAVELVESNLAILKEKSKGIPNLQSFQGDATDLSRFADDSFDVTLFFGPMYHLYEEDEVKSCDRRGNPPHQARRSHLVRLLIGVRHHVCELFLRELG